MCMHCHIPPLHQRIMPFVKTHVSVILILHCGHVPLPKLMGASCLVVLGTTPSPLLAVVVCLLVLRALWVPHAHYSKHILSRKVRVKRGGGDVGGGRNSVELQRHTEKCTGQQRRERERGVCCSWWPTGSLHVLVQLPPISHGLLTEITTSVHLFAPPPKPWPPHTQQQGGGQLACLSHALSQRQPNLDWGCKPASQ